MSVSPSHHRHSWKAASATTAGSNRWGLRLLVTALAVLTVGGFVMLLLRRRPDVQVHAVYLHAGSYDLDTIMPLMFADEVSRQVRAAWSPTEMTGERESIAVAIDSDTGLAERLRDPDDTVIVLARGYLMTDDRGEPAIACSDLSIGDGQRNEDVRGLLPLANLVDRLLDRDVTSDAFIGHRVILLDAEPLAVHPRLGQASDRAFAGIDRLLGNLSGPHADRLWVVIPRGPLQNAGWDAAAGMPIAAQTILTALDGAADLDGNAIVDLNELCRYGSANYEALTRSTGDPAVRWTIFRGGAGALDRLPPAAGDVRLAKIGDDQSDSEDTIREPDVAPETAADEAAARRHHAWPPISRVAYTPRSQDSTVVADQTSDPPPIERDDQDDRPDANGPTPAEPPPETFWDVITRIERSATEARTAIGEPAPPHPAAVAPQLYRRWILTVLYSTVRARSAADKDDSLAATSAIADAKLIERTMTGQTGIDPGRANDELVGRMIRAMSRPRPVSRPRPDGDSQTAAADALQDAIAIAAIGLLRIEAYGAEALTCATQPIDAPARGWNRIDEAIQTLGRDAVDERDLISAKASMDELIAAADRSIAAQIDQILDDGQRVGPGQGWNLTRRILAVLRSPVGDGKRRRRLEALLRKQTIATLLPEELIGQSVALAEPEPPVAAATTAEDRLTPPSEVTATRPSGPGVGFIDRFAAALRTDPIDARDIAAAPIVHPVLPRPRTPQPTLKLVDDDGAAVSESLAMQARSATLSIQIDPDLDQPTEFIVTATPSTAGPFAGSPPLALTWGEGDGVTEISDLAFSENAKTARVEIPASATGRATLTIRASDEADADADVSIELSVEPTRWSERFETPQSLDRKFKIAVRPPRPDLIRAIVRTDGLSRPVRSGDDNLPGGVWLRTFVGRPTTFRLSLANASGRPSRARLWLIKLDHPFLNQGVTAYWPETLRRNLDRLTAALIGPDRRVRDAVLTGTRRLKGPIDLQLPGGNRAAPLDWLPPPSEGQADSPPTAAAPIADNSSSASAVDVSHGVVLVARLLDPSGNPDGSSDQIIWLFPKPWNPKEYVDVRDISFQGDQVAVRAMVKSDFDSDGRADSLPEPDRAVELSWTQSPDWANFETNLREPLLPRRTQLLIPGTPPREAFRVPVRIGAIRPVVQLDVDGWPRAIRQSVARGDASARTLQRHADLRVRTVEVDYGDAVPSRSDDDLPQEPRQRVHYPDEQTLVFRGRARAMRAIVAADCVTDYMFADPPRVRIGGQLYWTDRIVQTRAITIGDDGSLTLESIVNDLSVDLGSFASAADDKLELDLSLRHDGEPLATRLNVLLDSTPPEAPRVTRANRSAKLFEDGTLKWTLRHRDPSGTVAGSGVDRMAIAPVEDRGESPGIKRLRARRDEFTDPPPQQPGRYLLAFQVWDRAGWASEVTYDGFRIFPRPENRTLTPPVPGNGASSAKADPGSKTNPEPPRRGVIAGKIMIGSTMRGELRLEPKPDQIVPANATVEVGGSNPTFRFSNVPAGEYTLSFEGTVNGIAKPKTWSGLKIDRPNNLTGPR